jgi:antitoxin FitA
MIAFAVLRIIMPAITIRNLDPETKEALRVRAARHGRSMEDHVRHLIKADAASDGGPAAAPGQGLGTKIAALFAPIGGLDLDLPPRAPDRGPPDFS